MTLLLSRSVVEGILTMPLAMEVVEEGFRRLAEGKVAMPQRAVTVVAPYHGTHLSMPVFVDGDPGALAVKVVTVFSDNLRQFGMPSIQATLLLHDPRTGKLEAILDGECLTAMRTGAVCGVATRLLARPESRTMTLFGVGAQAGPQLEAVCLVRPIEQVWVVSAGDSREAAFCTDMSEKLGIPVQPAPQVRKAVEEADIIATATNAREPVFRGAWLQPGAHINAIGAYTPTMRELDSETLRRSRLFVDLRRAAEAEAGDLLMAVAEGSLTLAAIAGELGELLAGKIEGRTDPREITTFKSVGLALQDAVTAARVVALARDKGLGQEIQL
ncbi:MAG: ornithine cyclodeaminase family protein [bacterium]